MPPPIASIELVAQSDGTATFAVHDEDKKDKDEYSKWVTVNGYGPYTNPDTGVTDPDAHLSAAFSGIRWDEQSPPADDAVVIVSLGVNPAFPPDRFEAFVVLFPNVVTPRSNIVEF